MHARIMRARGAHLIMALALVAPPADPAAFLKGIKTLAPQIGHLKLPVGKFIALDTLTQFSGKEIKKRIGRHLKRKTKKKDRDDTTLIKVSEAIECVDKYFRDPDTIRGLAEEVLKVILAAGETFLGKPPDDILGEAADKCADCIRENCLRQDTPRARHRGPVENARPARGHGYGRRQNLRPFPPRR